MMNGWYPLIVSVLMHSVVMLLRLQLVRPLATAYTVRPTLIQSTTMIAIANRAPNSAAQLRPALLVPVLLRSASEMAPRHTAIGPSTTFPISSATRPSTRVNGHNTLVHVQCTLPVYEKMKRSSDQRTVEWVDEMVPYRCRIGAMGSDGKFSASTRRPAPLQAPRRPSRRVPRRQSDRTRSGRPPDMCGRLRALCCTHQWNRSSAPETELRKAAEGVAAPSAPQARGPGVARAEGGPTSRATRPNVRFRSPDFLANGHPFR